MKYLYIIGIIIMLTAATKTVSRAALGLRYFKASEFGPWYPLLSKDLLLKLDEFRHRWGAPVIISSAAGSIGREDKDSHSQHNVLRWGEVRAIDVFPTTINGYMNTSDERYRAMMIAREVGFTGIGLYTDTSPGNMLHVDVREDRAVGNPALWSRINGSYSGINEVLA